jgi:TolA-binding protein
MLSMTVRKAILFALVVLASFLPPGAATAQRNTGTGYTEDRLNQLQQSVAELTRRLEQLQKQNQQLQQQLDKMRASYQHRIEQLEKGNAAKTPPARARQQKP